ncbi:MAG: hypothetical protein AB7G48_16025 [Nitrospiraceae bacterium]
MRHGSAVRTSVLILFISLGLSMNASYAENKTKSYYSPIILVNKEQGYIVISDSGAVFGVEVPPEAKPNLDKLPPSGLIDLVVEIRPGQAPLVKKWTVMSGETDCRVFDGKECRP